MCSLLVALAISRREYFDSKSIPCKSCKRCSSDQHIAETRAVHVLNRSLRLQNGHVVHQTTPSYVQGLNVYITRLGSLTCGASDKENVLVRARDFHVIYLYMVMSRFWYMHRYPSPRRRRTFSGISPLSLAARISLVSLESHSSASGHGLTLGML